MQQGKLIAAGMDPGTFCPQGATHEILVYGYNRGHANVLDPYFSSHNGSYPISIFWEQKSTEEDDCLAGGPLFAIWLD